MCPACIQNLGLAVAGLISSGGITALVHQRGWRRRRNPSLDGSIDMSKPRASSTQEQNPEESSS
jgi:hypothetical protein